MDIITIVWQISTFIALIVFFVYLACAAMAFKKHKVPAVIEQPAEPPPSYLNFAPPSYATVTERMISASRVFFLSGPGEHILIRNEPVAGSSRDNRDLEANNTYL
jgi:hypothetical protein